MSTSGEQSTGSGAPSIEAQLIAGRAEGYLIHDFSPEVTRWLAGAPNWMYTTTEPRDPGSLAQGLNDIAHERDLATIGERVTDVLGNTKEFGPAAEAGLLGSSLIETFSAVQGHIEVDDIHWKTSAYAKGEQHGIAASSEMRLLVPDPDKVTRMSVALQGILRTGSADTFYPVTADTRSWPEPRHVTIGNFDEHGARALSRAVGAVVALEDKQKHGVTLPPTKHTYEGWLQEGETFPPHFHNRFQAALQAYRALGLVATYRDRPDLRPILHKRIIGTDAAAVFEAMRDAFNGLIYDVRGGSHLNLEQHPDPAARVTVEAGLDLRRDKVTLDDVRYGPPSSRAPRLHERGRDYGTVQLGKARKRPVRTLIRTALKIPTGGGDLLTTLIKRSPESAELVKNYANDIQEWQRRKDAAQEGGKRLDAVIHDLSRRGLIRWPKE